MNVEDLRKNHPKLTYKSYEIEQSPTELTITFTYHLEPNYIFTPQIRIPLQTALKLDSIANMVFHLGILEGLNYWKLTASPTYHIEAGTLSAQQKEWWHNFFLNSLGEYYFVNNIDFTTPNFLQITSVENKHIPIDTNTETNGQLILSSGGKDSAVTLELLHNHSDRQAVFTQLINNPTRAPHEAAQTTGYSTELTAKKTIDPLLIELTSKGYLKGHVPFSAMIAFLSVLVAKINGYKYVIASNENSANEANLRYLGKEINHQYAKSSQFEKNFREYLADYMTKDVDYFSFLRPLSELQIAFLFSQYPQHHLSFRSCNAGLKNDSWCGQCAKCAFIYLILFPFLPYSQMLTIFGSDYLSHPSIIKHLKDLIGLGEYKPLECVGTKDEAILALNLVQEKYKSENIEIPSELQQITNTLPPISNPEQSLQEALNQWNTDNNIPENFQSVLKNALQEKMAQWKR